MKSSPRNTVSIDDFSPKTSKNHRKFDFPAPKSREHKELWTETIKICTKQATRPNKPHTMREKMPNLAHNSPILVISSEVRPAKRIGLLADEHFVFRQHPHIQLSLKEYETFKFNAVELQNKARSVCEMVAECSEGFEVDPKSGEIRPVSVEKFELCTLDEVINAKKALKMSWKTNELWNLMTQLVDILATLQQHHICHRDIKPANILIDETLKNYKLTNFAIACELKEITSDQSGENLIELPAEGTPAYAGPLMYNALMNKQESVLYEPVKADVYSVGRIFDSILQDEDIESHKEIRQLVERLLSVEYKDRPTFVELKEMLEDKPHRVGEMSADDIKAITIEILRYFWDRKNKIEATCVTSDPGENTKPADFIEKTNRILDILSNKMLNFLHLSPDDYASRLNNLATSLWLDNQNEIAAHCFELVKTYQESTMHQTDNSHYATALKGLGDTLLDLEEYDESLHHHVKSSILWNRLNGVNDREYADALYGIGSALLYKGDYYSAIQYLTQSVKCRRIVGMNLQLGFTLVRLGDALHLNGEPEKARECCLEACEIQKKICGEEHPEYAVTLGLLGDLLAEGGEHEAALENLNAAANIQRKLKGNRSSDLAVVLQSIGKVYQMMKNYEKAAEYMSESLKMEKELNKEKGDSHAIGVFNLGTVFHDMEQYQSAIECYEEAMSLVYGSNEGLYEEFAERFEEAREALLTNANNSEEENNEESTDFHKGKLIESRKKD